MSAASAAPTVLSPVYNSYKFPIPDYYSSFDWSAQPPLSSIIIPLIVVPLYLVTIYSIQYYVKTYRGGKGFNVNLPFAYHNLILSIMSLIMFVGCAIEVARRYFAEGDSLTWLLCEHQHRHATGTLYFWSYLYYLSKYYELLDTVFLALKGSLRGWGGLNVYHHAVVVFMAWWWLEYAQSLQFYGLLFNTSVHVIMYYYFFLTGLGIKPSWRGYITKYQILQFVTSCSLLIPTLVLHFTSTDGGCQGMYATYANLVFNLTLLSEFMSIARTSDSKTKTTKSTTTTHDNGHTNGHTKKIE